MTATPNSTSPGDPQTFKLRVEDYELLDRAGAFRRQRVELIGGRVIVVNAQFKTHALVKTQLGYRLQTALASIASPYMAIVEGSLALPPHDLPDPDILVAVGTAGRDYFRIEDVALIVEVADTSIRYDLLDKRDLYAVGRVREYWVVDVNARLVHQFWSLGNGSYTDNRAVPLDGALQSMTMPELAIDGSGIL